LAVTDWRLRRWRLWFLALMTANRVLEFAALTASFRTAHRIPEPTLRAATQKVGGGPDPRSELERTDPDAFQSAHKVTRQARRFDAEAPEVAEAAAVDAEEALHREAPDDADDEVAPTLDPAGPTLLRLLGGPVPLAPRGEFTMHRDINKVHYGQLSIFQLNNPKYLK